MRLHNVKMFMKASVGALAEWLGVSRMLFRGKVLILTYHRVVEPADILRMYVEPGMYVLRDVFEMQLRWLSDRFEMLSLSDLLEKWNTGEWDERKAYCVITFDDGWLDNYQHAFPILKKYRIPATIFLPVSFIGSSEWFWPEKIGFLLGRADNMTAAQQKRVRSTLERAGWQSPGGGYAGISGSVITDVIGLCKRLHPSEIESLINALCEILGTSIPNERVTMNWEEISEMARSRVTFGSHSCSHSLLTLLDRNAVERELQESGRVLRSLPAGYVPVFCYPNGDNSPAVQDSVRQSGFRAAVGTREGAEGNRPGSMFEIKRITMHNDISATKPLLSFHLTRAASGL